MLVFIKMFPISETFLQIHLLLSKTGNFSFLSRQKEKPALAGFSLGYTIPIVARNTARKEFRKGYRAPRMNS